MTRVFRFAGSQLGGSPPRPQPWLNPRARLKVYERRAPGRRAIRSPIALPKGVPRNRHVARQLDTGPAERHISVGRRLEWLPPMDAQALARCLRRPVGRRGSQPALSAHQIARAERLRMIPLPGRWQIRWQVGIDGRSGARQLRNVHDLRRGREHLPLRASCKPDRSEPSAKMRHHLKRQEFTNIPWEGGSGRRCNIRMRAALDGGECT